VKKIFIGLLLVFLDFNLNLGNAQIGLIPDFIGYIVMGNGLIEMAAESQEFSKVRAHAAAMAGYTGILYVLDLTGISVSLGYLAYLLAIASTLVSLYISWHVVAGVREMEEKYGAFLNGDSLKSAWTILAVFSIAAFAYLLFPALGVICIIAAAIVAIVFLVAFSKSRTLYYELKEGACMPRGSGE
jgi:hypothetical protein